MVWANSHYQLSQNADKYRVLGPQSGRTSVILWQYFLYLLAEFVISLSYSVDAIQ